MLLKGYNVGYLGILLLANPNVTSVQNDWGSTAISRPSRRQSVVRDFPNNTNTTSPKRSTLTSDQDQPKSLMLYHQPRSNLTHPNCWRYSKLTVEHLVSQLSFVLTHTCSSLSTARHFLHSNGTLRSKRSPVLVSSHLDLVCGGAVMSNAGSETSSEPLQKYHPFQLGPSEDLEWYEPGWFHPVHLQDEYDLRYSIVHKLGFGGFSTVWLARDSVGNEWVALKILASETSTTSTARPSILEDDDINHRLFSAYLNENSGLTAQMGVTCVSFCPSSAPAAPRCPKGSTQQ